MRLTRLAVHALTQVVLLIPTHAPPAQVRDLMIYIEAGRSIAAAGEEMKEASLLPVPAHEPAVQPKGVQAGGGEGRFGICLPGSLYACELLVESSHFP